MITILSDYTCYSKNIITQVSTVYQIKGVWTLLLNYGKLRRSINDLLEYLRYSEFQATLIRLFGGLTAQDLATQFGRINNATVITMLTGSCSYPSVESCIPIPDSGQG